MSAFKNQHDTKMAIKIASVCLMLFLMAGTFASLAHGIYQIGFFPQTVTTYYLGAEEEMIYPKELSELNEWSHVHIFMIPLIFFVLCYFFAQTSFPAHWKGAVILLSFANIAGFLIAPYLIRFLSPGFAVMVPLHEIVFLLCTGILTVVPFREVLKERK
jgi:hypothetical protein